MKKEKKKEKKRKRDGLISGNTKLAQINVYHSQILE